ncbi:MAG: hypothetical protein K6A65_04175 [Succinivibrionaceae bacterium]|nr:hypothetical protein [Succinivibrionaceae bacterium]
MRKVLSPLLAASLLLASPLALSIPAASPVGGEVARFDTSVMDIREPESSPWDWDRGGAFAEPGLGGSGGLAFSDLGVAVKGTAAFPSMPFSMPLNESLALGGGLSYQARRQLEINHTDAAPDWFQRDSGLKGVLGVKIAPKSDFMIRAGLVGSIHAGGDNSDPPPGASRGHGPDGSSMYGFINADFRF